MAIDRIPGVGPTNADIATAVAAPSAATIAAAVAAPSAATIASAVNAPSAATIAAAVAAPSAATIATQVAASVPTLTQINTSVSNNSAASPFWTLLGSNTDTNPQLTRTISGLSTSYTVLRIITAGHTTSGNLRLRFNGDSGTNSYAFYAMPFASANQNIGPEMRNTEGFIRLTYTNANGSTQIFSETLIENYSSSSVIKYGRFSTFFANTSNVFTMSEGRIVYAGSATPITSVSLFSDTTVGHNAANFCGFWIFGAK